MGDDAVTTRPGSGTTRASRAPWWPLLVLLGITFVLRVGWAAWIAHHDAEAVRSPDTPSYLGPAHALLEDQRFNEAPGRDTPIFFRTPGYPAVLAGMLLVTGSSEWAISPIQAGLSLLIVVLVYWLGRQVLSPGGTVLAAAIVAFDPLQFAASGTVLTEAAASLSLVLVAVAAWRVFFKPRRSPDYAGVALLGLAIAVATLIRPTTYYFPLIAIVFVVLGTRGLGFQRVLVSLLLFAVPLVVVVGGWQVRNHDRVGTTRLAGIDAYNLNCYRAADVEARAEGFSLAKVREQRGCPGPGSLDPERGCPKWARTHPGDTEKVGPCYDEMASRGIRTLLDHPTQTATMTVRGFARAAFGPGTDTVGRYLGRTPGVLKPVLAAWTLALWTTFALGLWGVFRRGRDGRLFWAFTVVVIAYVLAISAGTDAYARTRTPVIPLIALVAGAAWPVLGHWTRALTSGRAPAGAVPADGSTAAP